jgi:hypothetical protein
MSSESQNPRVPIKPEEDARLPVLEAQIEREWRSGRPGYVKDLIKRGELTSQVHETALDCLKLIHQFEERGLGADQAREAMQSFINPQWDNS